MSDEIEPEPGTPTPSTDYIKDGNDASNVRLIKEYALFLYPDGETYTKPTSTAWQPGEGKQPIGYSSEDGVEITAEAGDTSTIKAHNGDTVVEETSDGNWIIKLAGIESKQEVAEAYFGVKAVNGVLSVTSAANNTKYALVLAGLDQYGRPILLHAASCTVGDREAIKLSSSEEVSYGISFKTFKDSDGKHFDLYGMFPTD
ncbi:hypothetical protein [Bifidobacterium sp.]|uniref:phage tail tube protein n=1 Tax=Bifidobacterium sp. TaxID=41200 RepID=UPI0039E8DB3B